MKIRTLGESPLVRPGRGVALPLGAQSVTTVGAEPDQKYCAIELDLAVVVPDGSIGLLLPTPGLLELGLVAALPAQVLISTDQVKPLRILVLPPAQPVRVPVGVELARLVIIPAVAQAFYDDANIDDLLDPDLSGPYLTIDLD